METIFILSNMREYGGAEHSIATLIPEFLRSVRVVVFVENDRHGDALRRSESDRLSVISLPKGNGPKALWRSLRIVRQHYLEERPRALLANGHKGSLMLVLLQGLLPGPRPRYAVYVRDFDYYTLRWTLWAMRDFHFFAPSPAVFEHPPYRSWGLTDRTYEVISNAVVAPARAAEVSNKEERFIGCCARITPWKGLQYLIRAFGLLVADRPAARLRIYGDVIDAEYYATLQALLAELGLRAHVAFHPFTSDLTPVYRAGLFFVVPSLSISPGPESFCRIIIEAWSHARPVIAFAAGGPRHLIAHHRDGWLVEERNVEELAAGLRTLFDDRALCQRMGEAGYDKVRHAFDPRIIAGKVLERLLGNRLPAPTDAREPSAKMKEQPCAS